MTKTGTGNLTLNFTSNPLNISFTVSDGSLVTTNGSGTLSLSTNSTVSLANGTKLVLAQAGTANVSSAVSGAGQVWKTGTGASTLSGSITYTGGTNVQVGTLTYGSSFNMSSGSANELSLTGAATPTAGTHFGQIRATTGTFTYGGTLGLSFTGTAVVGATYNLFDFSGATQAGSFSGINVSNAYVVALTNNSGVWTGDSGEIQFKFTESTGDLEILAAIPEPSSFAAFAGLVGVATVGLRRRRRA